jgi:hypothetical protein
LKMYSVRSDPLPWERLRTGVRGSEASVKSAVTRAREREREKEKEKLRRKKSARVLRMN